MPICHWQSIQTIVWILLITHLKFIFHLSFSEAALMAKRTKKVGITGKYGTRYEMHGKIREVIAKPGTAPPWGRLWRRWRSRSTRSTPAPFVARTRWRGWPLASGSECFFYAFCLHILICRCSDKNCLIQVAGRAYTYTTTAAASIRWTFFFRSFHQVNIFFQSFHQVNNFFLFKSFLFILATALCVPVPEQGSWHKITLRWF